MQIREAVTEDAPAACEVIRRSIAELCFADHGNDPEILARWLANKKPEIVATWIARPDLSTFVVIENGAILAAGSVTDTGEINLLYSSPDARFRGVSRTLLAALEKRALERGNTVCNLSSTETALRFYLASGYVIDGLPTHKFGPGGYPMSKNITGSG